MVPKDSRNHPRRFSERTFPLAARAADAFRSAIGGVLQRVASPAVRGETRCTSSRFLTFILAKRREPGEQNRLQVPLLQFDMAYISDNMEKDD